MNADTPFLAKHGESQKRWEECVQPLNALPEFGPQLSWNGARFAPFILELTVSEFRLRDKFKDLIKIHEAQDNAGRVQTGSDAIVDETVALLDDILALVKDQRDEKYRQKIDAQAKEAVLNEQGQTIRDSAMKSLGKRTKSGDRECFLRIHLSYSPLPPSFDRR